MAVAAATANCTRFFGRPDSLDRMLKPARAAVLLGAVPRPFSGIGCREAFCVHRRHGTFGTRA